MSILSFSGALVGFGGFLLSFSFSVVVVMFLANFVCTFWLKPSIP